MSKIIASLLFVLFLFYAGFYSSTKLYDLDNENLHMVVSLMQENIILIVVINFLFYLLDSYRFQLISKIFNLDLSFKESFYAITLNIMFAWLTPGAILGAPASAYYLYKKGYGLAQSLAVSFIRSFLIIFTSAMTTILITYFETHGNNDVSLVQTQVHYVLIAVAVYLIGLIVLSFLPKEIINRWKFLEKLTSKVRDFVLKGPRYSLQLFSISFVLNFLLVSFLFFVALQYYDNVLNLFSQCMLFLSYLLLMPTPGASGLAEVGAPAFFSSNLPINFMITATSAMRISTFFVQVLIGIGLLGFILKDNFIYSDLKTFRDKYIKNQEGRT